jgi:hypothetical protein
MIVECPNFFINVPVINDGKNIPIICDWITILVEPNVNPCILYILIGVAVIMNDIIEYAKAAVTIA